VLGVDANRLLEILAGFFNGIADASSSKALIHRINKQRRCLASRCIVPSSGSVHFPRSIVLLICRSNSNPERQCLKASSRDRIWKMSEELEHIVDPPFKAIATVARMVAVAGAKIQKPLQS
jgi:hypothetical protein